MHIIKPSWPLHLDEKERPTTIYTLAVHPDGSRLATGGLDTKIKIWTTAPILKEEVENMEKVPKLLCTMTSHAGVVMCIRWSNAGRYLASGSDDNIVMIWNLETGAGGKVWGSTETNIENWKASRRLVGHDSDVSGVAWSPDDQYLASVGLDSTVLIWSGVNFQLLRRLDAHMGFVKGVVFDPVGMFLATQSDDNTVKIWRTSDWRLEKDITAPFIGSPKTNLMRLTWSPEGTHLVTPNSMNGPVFVAAVIDRHTWHSHNSMVGHENIVEVSAFSPLIFLRDPKLGPTGTNLCTLLALTARSSISLWITSQSQPLVVFDDVFDRDVLDLSWSADGTQLWASSSEGHVAVFTFDPAEFGTLAPPGTKDAFFRQTYNYAPRLPVSTPASSQPSSQTMTNGGPALGTISQPNTLVARKGPGAKRRIVPQAQAPVPVQAPIVQHQQPVLQQHPILQQQAQGMAMPMQQAMHGQMAMQAPMGTFNPPPVPQQPSSYASTSVSMIQPMMNAAGWADNRAPPPPGAFGHPQAPPQQAGWGQHLQEVSRKRRAEGPPAREAESDSDDGYLPSTRTSSVPYRKSGRTLGEERSRAKVELRELRPAYIPREREMTFKITNAESGKKDKRELRVLAVPAAKTFGSVKVVDEEDADSFEWRNFGEGKREGTSEVAVVTEKKTLWVDYLPKYVVCGAGSEKLEAVSLEDGSLIVYSPTGRRLLPTLVLDSPCSFLEAEGPFLMAITALGSLTVWNTALAKSLFPPLSVSALLTSSATRDVPHPTITTAALRDNGMPLISLSSGSTHSYDADLSAWSKLSEVWWAKESDFWEARRGKAGNAGRGIIRGIESAINDIIVDSAMDTTGDSDDDEDDSAPTVLVGAKKDQVGSDEMFKNAVGLGHLETRMKAAIALGSAQEYRTFLVQYAKKLAEEGFRNKAEELVIELLGPIYYKPTKDDTWSPTVIGVSKRDLLKEVLSVFAKSRMLATLGTEYQDILKKMSA